MTTKSTPELSSEPGYEIGLATTSDAYGITQVRKAVWCDTYIHKDTDPIKNIALEDLEAIDYDSEERINFYRREAANTENQQILVARDGQKVAGVIVGRKNEDYNTFVTFFVLPEYQNQGIGQQLYDRTIQWLGRDKPVIIDVVEYNLKSLDMYRRRGFEVTSDPQLHESGKLPTGKHIYELQMTLQPTDSQQ
jgi:GNAT superfamily N-acetyltransferase